MRVFFVCIVADGYTIRPTVYAVYATLWPVIHRGSAKKKRHNTVENRSGKGESYRKPGVMHGPYRWSNVVFAPLSSCPLFWCVFPFRTLTAHGSFVIVAWVKLFTAHYRPCCPLGSFLYVCVCVLCNTLQRSLFFWDCSKTAIAMRLQFPCGTGAKRGGRGGEECEVVWTLSRTTQRTRS